MIVVDTNIYFSALYNPEGNESEIVRMANADQVTLLSPDLVQEELKRVLRRKLGLSDEEISSFITSLPTIWVPKNEYSSELDHAKSMLAHEEDSPILACALRFQTAILTGNKRHFDIPQVREEIPVLSSKKLLRYLKSKKDESPAETT